MRSKKKLPQLPIIQSIGKGRTFGYTIARSSRLGFLLVSRLKNKLKIHNGLKFLEFRPNLYQIGFLAGALSWSKRTGRTIHRLSEKKPIK
jgi:hypothetical protein